MTGNVETVTLESGCKSKVLCIVGGEAGIFPAVDRLGGFTVMSASAVDRHIVLEDNSEAEMLAVILPGAGDTSLDFRIEMTGPGAVCRLSGIYLCPESERLHINVSLTHKAGGCSSFQSFKGIVSGRTRVDFTGRIVVCRDAQKTEAFQENQSLLLSDDARVDTSPQLEIYADDVKCSHGAAVGRLDENEQFYMRSRGIPEKEAKVLQMLSFLSSAFDAVPEGPDKDLLSDIVERTIRTCF